MKQRKVLPFYRALCARLGIRSSVDDNLEVSAVALVPHALLRRTLENDPAMEAILEGGAIHFALGSFEDAPFVFLEPGLIQLSSALIFDSAALSVAARWGLEAHHMRWRSELEPRQLVGLARYGKALIEMLEETSRERLLAVIPPSVGAELVGARFLDRPGEEFLSWLAGLTRSVVTPEHADSYYGTTELEYPIERVLARGGDSRIEVNSDTGCNRYGVPPRPRPEAIHFSSSTASAITDYGFFLCDLLRRDLLSAIDGGNLSEHDARSRLANTVGLEILALFGLDETVGDVAVAPSGTDTELLAVLVARSGAQGRPLVNVLIAPDESGSGVRLAASGCYFDDVTAAGAHVARGTPVWADAGIAAIREIPIRDGHGNTLAPQEVNRNFLEICHAALREGNHLLVHVLMSSKTDLYAPDFDAVAELAGEAPDRVDAVVDACQLRAGFGALGDFVRRGWMVQVSGSKFLTGPPFSGALIMPASLRPRAPAIIKGLQRSPGVGRAVDWIADWSAAHPGSVGGASYGALFRWLPALLEAKLLFQLPEDFRLEIASRFREALSERMSRSGYLRPLRIVKPPTTDGAKGITHSILSFVVLGRRESGELSLLNETECKQLFELLNRDAASALQPLDSREEALARQPVHIGQPVTLGSAETAITVLRLVLGARFFTIVGHVDPGSRPAALESEIADAKRAIAKVELLASYWWRVGSAHSA